MSTVSELEQALEALTEVRALIIGMCGMYNDKEPIALLDKIDVSADTLKEAIKTQGEPVLQKQREAFHAGFTSAPTIPECENQAVRMFLMYYGGNNGVTVQGMRESLRTAGYDDCWPDWVIGTGKGEHLTKAGAQDWIKHMLLSAAPKGEKE